MAGPFCFGAFGPAVMPGLTGHLPLRRFCFGRFLGRKLSLAPPERDPIRANSFRLEARHSAGAPSVPSDRLPSRRGRWPGGFVRCRSLRTLPPFPASPLRGNLSPAGPARQAGLYCFPLGVSPAPLGAHAHSGPWPRGATPPATFPSLPSSTPVTPVNLRRSGACTVNA